MNAHIVNINKQFYMSESWQGWQLFAFKGSYVAWAPDQVGSTVKHESVVLCCQSPAANCYWQAGWRDGGRRGTETTTVYLSVDL